MSPSAVAAFGESIGPWARSSLAFLVWNVTRRVAALVVIARRRGSSAVILTHLLGDESKALGLVLPARCSAEFCEPRSH
eukprot:5347120-Pleurochrysis_carterae.AAC.1